VSSPLKGEEKNSKLHNPHLGVFSLLEDRSMIQDYGSYSYRLLVIILGDLKRK